MYFVILNLFWQHSHVERMLIDTQKIELKNKLFLLQTEDFFAIINKIELVSKVSHTRGTEKKKSNIFNKQI